MDAVNWEQIKIKLKEKFQPHTYRMWIEPIGFGFHEENTLELTCVNAFSQRRIQENFGGLIREALAETLGENLEIRFALAENRNSSVGKLHHQGNENLPVQKPASLGQMELPQGRSRSLHGRLFRKDYTFDQFVVGRSNDFAYTAALSMASRKKAFSHSLFLCSNTGMGKSHLSQAVGHQIIDCFPGERVYYMSAEDFTNEMVGALRSGTADGFKEKYRTHCDVLLMEDVHFLAGKEKTQQELAMVLDYLFEAEKKVIFSGCALPAEIPKLTDSFRSRLSSGLVSSIEKPDFQTRVKIARQKCKDKGIVLSQEVIEFLAGELEENVRQLESGLIGMMAQHSLLHVPMDLELAEAVVRCIASRKQQVTVQAIKKLICREFGISMDDLVSKSRKQNLVRGRQMAIYLSRKYTDQSIQSIGRSFNRYHATAIHAINTVEKSLREKTPLARQLEILSGKIEKGEL